MLILCYSFWFVQLLRAETICTVAAEATASRTTWRLCSRCAARTKTATTRLKVRIPTEKSSQYSDFFLYPSNPPRIPKRFTTWFMIFFLFIQLFKEIILTRVDFLGIKCSLTFKHASFSFYCTKFTEISSLFGGGGGGDKAYAGNIALEKVHKKLTRGACLGFLVRLPMNLIKKATRSQEENLNPEKAGPGIALPRDITGRSISRFFDPKYAAV